MTELTRGTRMRLNARTTGRDRAEASEMQVVAYPVEEEVGIEVAKGNGRAVVFMML